MKDFIESNLLRIICSTGFLGIIQLIGHLRDYLSDGQLDTHEIEQLLLSTTSATQTVILLIVVIYIKLFKNKD